MNSGEWESYQNLVHGLDEVALKFANFKSYIWSIITGWILKKYEVAIIRLSLQNKDTFLARARVWIKTGQPKLACRHYITHVMVTISGANLFFLIQRKEYLNYPYFLQKRYIMIKIINSKFFMVGESDFVNIDGLLHVV